MCTFQHYPIRTLLVDIDHSFGHRRRFYPKFLLWFIFYSVKPEGPYYRCLADIGSPRFSGLIWDRRGLNFYPPEKKSSWTLRGDRRSLERKIFFIYQDEGIYGHFYNRLGRRKEKENKVCDKDPLSCWGVGIPRRAVSTGTTGPFR